MSTQEKKKKKDPWDKLIDLTTGEVIKEKVEEARKKRKNKKNDKDRPKTIGEGLLEIANGSVLRPDKKKEEK